jgi:hypothetical protein
VDPQVTITVAVRPEGAGEEARPVPTALGAGAEAVVGQPPAPVPLEQLGGGAAGAATRGVAPQAGAPVPGSLGTEVVGGAMGEPPVPIDLEGVDELAGPAAGGPIPSPLEELEQQAAPSRGRSRGGRGK